MALLPRQNISPDNQNCCGDDFSGYGDSCNCCDNSSQSSGDYIVTATLPVCCGYINKTFY